MSWRMNIVLSMAVLATAACMGADDEGAETAEPTYEVDTLASVEYPPDDVTTTTQPPSGVDLGTPPPSGIDLGTPPPEDVKGSTQEETALGWVSVSSSDGSAYEVWQQGSARGHTSIRLGQRPGVASYELRDEGGRRVCRGRVDVKRYETLCIECDVATGEFRRVSC